MSQPLTIDSSTMLLGLLLNFLTTVGAAAFIYGRLSADLESVKRSVDRDGDKSFVQRKEIDLLANQAAGEHRTFASEITTLRERTHAHERVLGEHETRITVLEDAS